MKKTALFGSSQACPTCPLDKSTVNMKMGMKYLCNNNERENPVPLQLRPLKTSHRLDHVPTCAPMVTGQQLTT